MSHTLKRWREQCHAARRIRDNFGVLHALDYLVGEKLFAFARLADADPLFIQELPPFVREVSKIFTPLELRSYLRGRRLPSRLQIHFRHRSSSSG